MEGSFKELRQIAHVSAQMSQDHMVTAFHSSWGVERVGGVVCECAGAAGGRRKWKIMGDKT
jgi:hypothetical protein